MGRFSSKSLLYFFVASLFSVLGQSFLLAPHQQGVLLKHLSVWQGDIFAAFLLLISHLLFSLVFFQHQSSYKKTVLGVTLLCLSLLTLLYARAGLWFELLSLVFFIGLTMYVFSREELVSGWFGRAGMLLNGLVGGVIFLFPFREMNASYLRLAPFRVFFGVFFLLTALLKLYLRVRKQDLFSMPSTRLLALPWIAWIVLFSIEQPIWAILLPIFLLTFAFLSCGLLPFNYFRLPDNKILGNSVFPVLSIFFLLLVASFVFLRHRLLEFVLVGDFLFFVSLALGAFSLYGVMRLHYLLYELTIHSFDADENNVKNTGFQKLVGYLFAPFQELRPLSEWQAKKIQRLSERLLAERENSKRFDILNLLRDQVDHYSEEPVVAQLVVNIVAKYFNADLALVFLHDIETRELYLYAIEGNLKAAFPPDYRQSMDVGTLGRAARLEKVQIVNDTSLDRDYINMQGVKTASEIFVPLIEQGSLKGMLSVALRKENAFSAVDVRVLEAVARELLKAWQRISHNRRMRTLIQSNISLSTSLGPHAAVEEIANVARKTLFARVVFVALLDQDGTFSRLSSLGYAPKLLDYLRRGLEDNPLLKIALHTTGTLRIRDISRYKDIPALPLDYEFLRGVLMVPIRLHGTNIGAIIAFGKENTVLFSEKDEALADLLANQAAAAIESSWLIQELRVNASTKNLLYNLSIQVIQTDTIREAARLIAETAHKLTKATLAGVVLFSADNEISTAIELSDDGQLSFGKTVPMLFVEQTLVTGEMVTISSGEDSAVIYLPIQTSLRKYGVLWIELPDSERQITNQVQSLKTLANQAAMVLERAMLLLDLREQAEALKDALGELEQTYDQTLSALMAALDARDRETEGHSARVGRLACLIAGEMNLSAEQNDILRRGALLHDIGKIGVSDNILHKPGPLTPDEWHIMRQHPDIGARIVQNIPFLAKTMPVIRYHHERWNGSGYPHGLAGEGIPLEARIFAIADVFDALTSVRPYRKIAKDDEAFDYIKKNAGILFDPTIVPILGKLIAEGTIKKLRASL